jgi:hypothetical protein
MEDQTTWRLDHGFICFLPWPLSTSPWLSIGLCFLSLGWECECHRLIVGVINVTGCEAPYQILNPDVGTGACPQFEYVRDYLLPQVKKKHTYGVYLIVWDFLSLSI